MARSQPEITRFSTRVWATSNGTEVRRDGPVSGSVAAFPVRFENIANNETDYQAIVLPAGMNFFVTDVVVYAGTVAGDPKLTVGRTLAGTQVCASHTIKAGFEAVAVKVAAEPIVVGEDDVLDVRIVADANDTIAEPVSVTVAGYFVSPQDSLAYRGRTVS